MTPNAVTSKTVPRSRPRRAPLALALAASTLAALAAGTVPQGAAAADASLPLGSAGLREVRTVTSLAPGVKLTRIVRGSKPATAGTIGSSRRGPWRISVVTIDPDRARGHLETTYGPDLARTERVSDLARTAGALVGVNAGYFTFGLNPKYPGDPVGLGLYRGAVLSEPAAVRTEVDVLLDAKTSKLRIGRLTWTGRVRNRTTGATLALDHLNHPPVVPKKCRQLKDPTDCGSSGDVVQFNRQFGRTPSGRGVEVVLGSSGCVVRTTRSRGTVLSSGQTSIQATGSDTRKVLAITRKGCLTRTVKLYDASHHRVSVSATSYGISARFQLTRNGQIVKHKGSGGYYARNPRTLVGSTASGKVVMVTIDGRRTTSVGATLAEEAAVAHSLGLKNSVNLDGGGSTTLAIAGKLANVPSGGSERHVGDALVYVDRPLG